MKKYTLFVLLFYFQIYSYKKPIEFTVIIPTYNNEKYCEDNLISVANQDYLYFDIVIINDCSKDKTQKILETTIEKLRIQNKVKLINNKQREGAMKNWYIAIYNCPSHKVIVMVDGDDKLAHKQVLTRLSKDYNDGKTWVTYGQYKRMPCGELGLCRAFPRDIIEKNQFRAYPWVSSHLRTGFAGLFQKIKQQDLFYKNRFYAMCADYALMYPAVEMASKGHIKYIPEILYLYNESNPIMDCKVNNTLQWDIAKHIRSRLCYKPLERLECLAYYQ